MRRLAWAALPYAAAVFLAEYFLPVKGLPIFAAALFLLAFVGLFMRGRARQRYLLVCLSAAVGFGWYAGHWALTAGRFEDVEKTKLAITARVTNYPQVDGDYVRLDVRLLNEELPHERAALSGYDTSLAALEPGDIIETTAYVTESSDYYAARDIYLRGYIDGETELIGQWEHSWLYFPQRISQALKNACEEVFPAFASPLIKGMMTGDTTDLKSEQSLYTAMKSCGVTHIVAVSGLHMVYLTGFILLLVGRGKRGSLICLPVIVLFVLMTGCTPSVVRAAVLQTMLLLAPLFDREADGVTDLAAALALLLVVNPNSISSVSLQLSFAAAAGMLLVSGRLRRWLYRRIRSRIGRYIADSLACTVGATIFSMPIAAYYFGTIPLLSALVNLLCLPLLELVFCAGYVLSPLGMLLPKVASVLAWAPAAAVWVCQRIFFLVASLPFACVYTVNTAVVAWLIVTYAGFALTFYQRRRGRNRRYIIPAAVSVSVLCIVVVLSGALERAQAGVTVLDVGQGESVVLYDENACVVVDCGGKNTIANAGETAAAYIRSTGRNQVDLLVLTHLHDDHANGVSRLLHSIPVRRIAFSAESFDDDELLTEILATAEQTQTQVMILSDEMAMTVGSIELELYQPLSGEDENERGLVVAADIRGTDVLVMGDMDSDGELTLVGQGRANTDILVAGHHGSKYSSSDLFLHAASPEWTVVSVGQNSYGHPTDEAMERIEDNSVQVRRTDYDGNVKIRIQ